MATSGLVEALRVGYAAARKAAGPDWTTARRDAAWERFLSMGLPTTRLEAWRSTRVSALGKIPFASARDVTPAGASVAAWAEGLLAKDLQGTRLVLVNGRLVGELSRQPALPEGVRLVTLDVALEKHRDRVEPLLGSVVSSEASAFAALNEAFLDAGVLLLVPRGVVVADPIHVVHLVAGDGEPVAAHPRTLIVLEEGAQARVIETFGARGESLTNAVTEIVLGEGAVLDHCQVQRQPVTAFHLSTQRVRQSRDSTFTSHVLSLGARLSRHDLAVDLAGQGASCALDGLSLLGGLQHADHHTLVDHAAPSCTSAEVYKGAFGGRSRGVFHGTVIVRPGAQGTSSRQENRNLLLSEDALVDTRPQLEIQADDVKCSHGATIGQLEADPLFYLRARGIGEAEARHVLTRAFAAAMIARLPYPALAEALEPALDAALALAEGAPQASGRTDSP